MRQNRLLFPIIYEFQLIDILQTDLNILQEQMGDHSQSQQSYSKEKAHNYKIFITDLIGSAKETELQSQLEQLLQNYGKLDSIVVKKSRNSEYCFAFVEYQKGADVEEAVRNLNNHEVKGKPMKVEFQDDSKRRKDPQKGCYTCGKKGHFAKECQYGNGSRGFRGRSRSRSDSRDRHRRKHRHKRSYSESSEEYRRRSRDKKSKKHRSRDRDEKKKKKHSKHNRRRSSSRSKS